MMITFCVQADKDQIWVSGRGKHFCILQSENLQQSLPMEIIVTVMMTGTDLMSCSISGVSGGLAMKTRPMLTALLVIFIIII